MILLDNLERQVLADRQVAAVFIAARAEGVNMPSFHEERVKFDAALVADPQDRLPTSQVDVEQTELRRALGVA